MNQRLDPLMGVQRFVWSLQSVGLPASSSESIFQLKAWSQGPRLETWFKVWCQIKFQKPVLKSIDQNLNLIFPILDSMDRLPICLNLKLGIYHGTKVLFEYGIFTFKKSCKHCIYCIYCNYVHINS